MARLITVQKSRKPTVCGRCKVEIPVGSLYYHWSIKTGPRSSYKSIRCADHRPRPSELTGNQYRQALLSAQEGFEDGQPYEDAEALAEALRAVAESVREVAEMLSESSNNIVDGFGHDTYQSDELRERSEALEEWATEIEQAADEAESGADDLECDECQEVFSEHGDDHPFMGMEDFLEGFIEVLGNSPE